MPIAQNDLHVLINKAFPEAQIKIVDLVGDENHYSVEIIDKSFAGKSRVEQHKMVNNALKGYLGDILHAMQLKTSAG
ncbi:MAG: BolA family transcriptional regulator [Rickettsiaceae bacterium]|jgi:stress-induced morphogen|nr:BolA family transcriptional regulator [Rickettsiaceae bacterium]